MNLSLWIIAMFSLSLPDAFELSASGAEPVRVDIFEAAHEWRSWRGPQGQALMLQYWDPMPLRDGGPAELTQRWTLEIAGQSVQMVEAAQLMGLQGPVYAAYFRSERPQATVIVYGTGFGREAFEALMQQGGGHFTSP